jgi:hypothetical protein
MESLSKIKCLITARLIFYNHLERFFGADFDLINGFSCFKRTVSGGGGTSGEHFSKLNIMQN